MSMRDTAPLDLLDPAAVSNLLSGSADCLIGVSGGIDSMVLLRWIADRRGQLGDRFRVMHVDHGINAHSDIWATTVQDACRSLDIRCDVKRVDLEGFGNNLEYAARQARYAAFCQSGADTLILAHHANDQCESFLLKLFRGSGVKGLKAMSQRAPCWFDPGVALVRPMLNISRDRINAWALANGVECIEDPSNADDSYDRNYIRTRVWPVIKSRFDIADVNTVRSIQHICEAWELTVALADIDIDHCRMADGTMEWSKLKALGHQRIKNVILRILDLEAVYGFSINHVEQFAAGMLSADMDSRTELSLRGVLIRKHGKRIIVERSKIDWNAVRS